MTTPSEQPLNQGDAPTPSGRARLARFSARPLFFAVVVVVALVIGALVSRGPSTGSALELQAGGFMLPAHVESDWHVMFFVDTVRARRPVTILSATPLALPPGVKLVDERFTWRGSPRFGGTAAFLGACLDRWPLPSLEPTFPLRGRELLAGERIAINLIVRPMRETKGLINGVRIRYREGGREFEQVSMAGKIEFVAADDPGDLPKGRATCYPDESMFVSARDKDPSR